MGAKSCESVAPPSLQGSKSPNSETKGFGVLVGMFRCSASLVILHRKSFAAIPSLSLGSLGTRIAASNCHTNRSVKLPSFRHFQDQFLGWPQRSPTFGPPEQSCHGKFRKIQKFPGRNISVICPGSCRVKEIQITSCPSKKEFFTSHFCDLYRGCAAPRKSSLRLHFLIF